MRLPEKGTLSILKKTQKTNKAKGVFPRHNYRIFATMYMEFSSRGERHGLRCVPKGIFLNPQPEPRFKYTGSFGITLYYQDFEAAVAFYTQVLGPVGYQEGDSTRGWNIGQGWLTLLRGNQGNPKNVETTFELDTVQQAEALQQAFIAAGAQGEEPSEQLMYMPVRIYPVTDPFGVDIMIFAKLI